MIASLSMKMAYRHVRAGFGRMALSVVAVALGVALIVAIRLMNAAVLHSFLDTVDGVAGRAALSVAAGEGIMFPEEVVGAVAAVPGVTLAVPLVRGIAFPDDGSGELLTVLGVDLANDAAVRVYHRAGDTTEMLTDVLLFLNQPDSIILGRAFAERKGLEIGDGIDLATPKGMKRFTIKGLLDPQGLARTLGGRLVVMDLYAAERAFTVDGQINQIDVLVADEEEIAVVKAAVAAVLPEGIRVQEPALRKDVIRKSAGGFQTMLTGLSLLAVVAGFVICYSRLGAVFEARTWEVGLLRAVGLRQGVVFVELLKESLLIGAAGTAVGIPLGSLIGRYGLPFAASATAFALRLPDAFSETAPRIDAFVLGAAVGILSAIAAAVMPALRLARTRPVAALTMRGREMATSAPRRGWGLRTVLLVMIVGLVVWQRISHITAIGHVTTAAMALAAWAFATPLVAFGGGVVKRVWQSVFGSTGAFAAEHVGREPGRSALTVATLGVGLGTVLFFGVLGWSFERTLVSRLTRIIRADLIISSAFVSGGYATAPISATLLTELAEVPGIAVVGSEQNMRYKDGVSIFKAYDAICFHDERVCWWPLDSNALPDALALVERGEAVLVTSSYANLHGTRPGDTITLDSPHGPVKLRVAGIASAEPENAVIMSRKRYREAWNDDLISRVFVVLDDGVRRADVEASIAGQLGARYRLHVRSGAELIDYFAGEVRKAFSLQYMLEAITFLLVLVGIGDTLASGIVDRTRELGMMRAVGLSQKRLFGMVMLEGAAIGLLGLFLAAVTGIALGVFWVEVQFPAVLGWKLDLHLPPRFALTAAALTMGLCLIGSLLPSIRAARMSVPKALRNE